MHWLLALLLVLLTALLVSRLAPWPLFLLLALLVGAGWATGVRGEPLWPWLLLGLGVLVAPRVYLAPRRRPRRRPPPADGRPGRPQAREEAEALSGRYEILEKVGLGGMATVYKAKDRKTGRLVALKVPQERFVGDPRFVRRFHREAEVLSRMDHPAIVKVYDHGQVEGVHYIAMEFLDGEGLDKLIEERRLSLKQAVAVLARVADALRHIHAQGIVHRDIKPGNVMVLRGALREDGVDPRGVRLMDFGIAAGKVLTRLTITGARIGTPVYMSPEQAKGQKLDHRSDIYSLGIVLYETLTGQPPFTGGYETVIHQQIFQVPTPPKQLRPEIPQALSDLVLRMLEKDPAKRPSLEEVIRGLEGPWQEEKGLPHPHYLLLGVEAKKGTVRLLDMEGTAARLLSGIGSSPGHFPAPPLAAAADPEGGIWVAVFEHGAKLLHRFSPEGELLLSAGPYGMRPGEFLFPLALAVADGTLFVLDGETATISRLDLKGQYQGRFGGQGPGRGTFQDPKALVAAGEHLFVLDYGNRQVQRLTPEGRYLSRYAFRRTKESGELRLLGGVGVAGERLYLYDVEAAKVRVVDLSGALLASYALPLLEGEDRMSLVELLPLGGVLYAARRGASRVHRIDLRTGEALPPLEVYAPVRSLSLWQKPA
ncbi:serine/threonine-protein kinase [Thermus thermamylovorans]|uniref:non-specific serine/threonine protein kinase n=1 Tax=Thermus thermamylovorans TaxID=2509362 RepID=A0A4Q9AZK8_9DEIN|nr:serine/threonine-protein kinase [Thermus thermamylovorans]TBH17621.1 serine/threonine protein kinase [Thermus thermamylovorans]